MSLVRLVARPMLASIFIVQGLKNFRDPEPLVGKATSFVDKAGPTIQRIAPQAPTDPTTLIRINAAAQIGAGAALAAGTFPRLASLVLVGSMVPTTLAGHAFWEADDPDERKGQRIQFLKNVGLTGGLLLASVDTEGKPGWSWRAKRAARDAKRATKTAKREAKFATKAAGREARLAARTAKAEVSSRVRR